MHYKRITMDTRCLDDPEYLPLYYILISVVFADPAEKQAS